jgi:alpha-tubulin suppressor-like RCC1 family protein
MSLDDIVSVATGTGFSCFLVGGSINQIKCVGDDEYGEVGLGTSTNMGSSLTTMGSYLPVVDLGGASVIKVQAGGYHTCALLSSASPSNMKCWGYNAMGQLGLGESTQSIGTGSTDMGTNLPVIDLGTTTGVGGGPNLVVLDFALGYQHTCAIVTGFLLKCWGDNSNGELGIVGVTSVGNGANDVGNNLAAVSLGANVLVLRISLGWYLTCALTKAYQIKCFGYNRSDFGGGYVTGQLGQGSTASQIPSATGQMGDSLPYIQLGTGYSAIGVGAGDSFVCALLNNQKVKCWGQNDSGQLGICSTSSVGTSPSQMETICNSLMIALPQLQHILQQALQQQTSLQNHQASPQHALQQALQQQGFPRGPQASSPQQNPQLCPQHVLQQQGFPQNLLARPPQQHPQLKVQVSLQQLSLNQSNHREA